MALPPPYPPPLAASSSSSSLDSIDHDWVALTCDDLPTRVTVCEVDLDADSDSEPELELKDTRFVLVPEFESDSEFEPDTESETLYFAPPPRHVLAHAPIRAPSPSPVSPSPLPAFHDLSSTDDPDRHDLPPSPTGASSCPRPSPPSPPPTPPRAVTTTPRALVEINPRKVAAPGFNTAINLDSRVGHEPARRRRHRRKRRRPRCGEVDTLERDNVVNRPARAPAKMDVQVIDVSEEAVSSRQGGPSSLQVEEDSRRR